MRCSLSSPSFLFCALLFLSGSAFAQQGAMPLIVSPKPEQFQNFPNIPACDTIAVLEGDPKTGPSVLLARLSPGCAVPWHWHTPDERAMMKSGTGWLAMKGERPVRVGPGAFAFLPSHHAHRLTCISGCEIFVTAAAAFDIHYVDEAGSEISFDQAMAAAKRPAAKKPTPAKE